MSLALLAKHLERRPRDNPFPRFRSRFERDLPMLQERGLAHYHAWAFATVRQVGGAFELASLYLKWLTERGSSGLDAPAAAFDRIQAGAKTLILKIADNVKIEIDKSAITSVEKSSENSPAPAATVS